jgi:S-adenosylmethionine:tRNA ribosyltransferase-isomerase
VNLGEIDYEHPEAAIAQRPLPERDASRMMVARVGEALVDARILDLADHFVAGDVLVLNDSRVQPARVEATKETGGHAEMLVLEHRCGPPESWLVMIKASHAPRPGRLLTLAGGCVLRVARREGDLFALEPVAGDFAAALRDSGRSPLPPYIRREPDEQDALRYQTVFARAEAGEWGSAGSSVAAPTAGLHLSAALIESIARRGVDILRLGLGVGPGTFRPIESERVEDHRMHEEAFEIPAETATAVTRALREGRRVTAVGTTSLRALEAAATPGGVVRAIRGRTGLYVMPGVRVRVVSRLLTNFHRPRSTLLLLVAGFAGLERALEIHETAVERGYRLFSYGDATLVERAS